MSSTHFLVSFPSLDDGESQAEATCPEVAAVEGKEGDQSQGLGGKREEEEVERTCSSSTSSSSRSLNLLLLFFLVVRQDDNLGGLDG